MRAALVTEVGAPARPGEHPEPRPGDGAALVRVSAAALNPVDLHIANGRFFSGPPRVPYVPGVEGVGTVVATGAATGRRVRFDCPHVGYGSDGAIGELAQAAEGSLIELPDGVDDAVAAGLGASGITAALALERAELRLGETVLVLGASGPLGQLALQLAGVMGAARTVAAARSVQGLERARDLGADATVMLTEGATRGDLVEAFREAGDGGPDVIVDALFGPVAAAALEAARPGARLVNVGRLAGDEAPFTQATLRNKAALGLSTHYLPEETKRATYRALLDHALAGRLTLEHEVLPLARVEVAWATQAASPGRKLVIDLTA